MGSFILCHEKKAKEPYYIISIRKNIYTLEELCFFLSHHLYLADEQFLQEPLFGWMEQELFMTELAKTLRSLQEQYASVSQLIMEILKESGIYTAGELEQIRDALTKLRNLKSVEKQKLKADNLLMSQEIGQAIAIYRNILYGEVDESVEKSFYGQVYAALGAAYGRMLLYEEAAGMYEAAYQICEKKWMLQAYLYACKKYMEPSVYQELLHRSELYVTLDELNAEKERSYMSEYAEVSKREIHAWKQAYRGDRI